MIARLFLGWCCSLVCFSHVCFSAAALRADEPTTTVQEAEQVLGEMLAIPGKRISEKLLSEAQAIAIIPRVIKIGFIAGVRRGHGVVMVRDAEGDWSLPQFITLTGGSVGWQAGIQGTDVVLVFTTRKSVEGLMKGKFTIGVDASASAGPVGRNAAAATDTQLKAEILSYSRSRGLFVGASVDGSSLDIDPTAYAAYYGVPNAGVPQRIPDSAAKLRQYLVELTPALAPANVAQPAIVTTIPGQALAPLPQPVALPAAQISAMRMSAIRTTLNQNVSDLQRLLTGEWRQYLAMPREIADLNSTPAPELVDAVIKRYAAVAQSPNYKQLTDTPEFQATLELLSEYRQALADSRSVLALPPPPAN